MAEEEKERGKRGGSKHISKEDLAALTDLVSSKFDTVMDQVMNDPAKIKTILGVVTGSGDGARDQGRKQQGAPLNLETLSDLNAKYFVDGFFHEGQESVREKRGWYNLMMAQAHRREVNASTFDKAMDTTQAVVGTAALAAFVNSISHIFTQTLDHRGHSYDKLTNLDEQIWAQLLAIIAGFDTTNVREAILTILVKFLKAEGYTVEAGTKKES